MHAMPKNHYSCYGAASGALQALTSSSSWRENRHGRGSSISGTASGALQALSSGSRIQKNRHGGSSFAAVWRRGSGGRLAGNPAGAALAKDWLCATKNRHGVRPACAAYGLGSATTPPTLASRAPPALVAAPRRSTRHASSRRRRRERRRAVQRARQRGGGGGGICGNGRWDPFLVHCQSSRFGRQLD